MSAKISVYHKHFNNVGKDQIKVLYFDSKLDQDNDVVVDNDDHNNKKNDSN